MVMLQHHSSEENMSESSIAAEAARARSGARHRRCWRDAADAEIVFDPFGARFDPFQSRLP
jgi:hypothetical protein